VRSVLECLVVVLLVTGPAGVLELLPGDDCPPVETSQTHHDCSPSCALCSCCYQAVDVIAIEPVLMVRRATPTARVANVQRPTQIVREVFHVPRLLRA
jgi:hypothetical protein